LLLAVSPFETFDDLNIVTAGARDDEWQCYCRPLNEKRATVLNFMLRFAWRVGFW